MTLTHIIKKIFFLFAILTLPYALNAQKSKLEKLEEQLKKHTSLDAKRVDILNEFAYETFNSNTEKAKEYNTMARLLADSIDYEKGKAKALWVTSLVYYKNNKKKATECTEEALAIAKRIGDLEGECNYLMATGLNIKALGRPEEGVKMVYEALDIALKNDFKELLVRIYYNLSIEDRGRGNFIEAYQKLQKVKDLAIELGNRKMEASSYTGIAIIFHIQGNYPKALQNYLHVLKINEELNSKREMINTYINIGGLQFNQNDFEPALENINKAHQLAIELKDSANISLCLTNIGNVYYRMNKPEALEYLEKALAIGSTSLSHKVNIIVNIAAIYSDREDFAMAHKYLKDAEEIGQKSGSIAQCAEAWQTMAKVYLAQEKYDQAIVYANKSLNVGKKISYLEIIKTGYKYLSMAYASSNKYKQAYESHVEFKTIADSIFNENNIRQLTLLEATYKHDKEKEVYEAERLNNALKIKNQRLFIIFLTLAIILIGILTVFIYRASQLKKKVLKLEIDAINHELEYSQKEVASAALKLVQSSESDAYCIKMLESIETNTLENNDKEVRSLLNFYKNKSTYSNWEEFETLFLKVNKAFYDNLNERFPNLTPNERKLCIFLKLNMNNKDIAQITFQSEEALKKARMRLRKKLDLTRDDNLVSYIQNI